MKTIKLQGKDYVPVSERLKHFRETYKDGSIKTTYEINDNRVIFRTEIYIGDMLISTGTGMKDTAKEFELEKAETRSIGRALAIAGIGLDAGISSYDEARDYFDKNPKKEDVATDKQHALIARLLESDGTLIMEYIGKEFGKTMIPELTKNEASKVIQLVKGDV